MSLFRRAIRLLGGTPPSPPVHFEPGTSFYDFDWTSLGGEARSLREFEGQVLLVVNVASKCGLTPQYAGLEALHQERKGRGFTVLGFPCNQFKGQEPGSADEIRSFCSTTYGVTFPLSDKVEVNGPGRARLYAWLTQQAPGPEPPGDILWNFEKFVIGRDGRIVARFGPRTAPDDPRLLAAIDGALDAQPES